MKRHSSCDSVCLHLSADGRRCRMLRKPGHTSLCPYHAKKEQKLLENDRELLERGRQLIASQQQFREKEQLTAQLASLGSGGKVDAHEVARALVGIYNALAEGRISSRSAATLGYLGQLLLQSLKPSSRPKPKPPSWPTNRPF